MFQIKHLLKAALISSLALVPLGVFAQDATTLTVVGVTVPPEEIGTPLDLAYQALVSSFEEANSNVTINVVEQPPEFETQIMIDLAAGTAPDVWRAGQALLPELIEGGYILDVRQCLDITPTLTMDRFIPSILAIHQPEGPEGPVYGVPNGFTPMVFYYNPEVFANAGVEVPTSDWTVEDFLHTTQMLTIDSQGRNAMDPDFDPESIEQYGVRVRKFFILENLAWVWAFGGDIISEDGTTVDGYLNSPETIEAITFLRDLVLENHVAPPPNALDQMIQERSFPSVFLDGQVAMYPRGQWEMVGLQNQENYDPGRVAVVGYPVGVNDATIAFEDGWVINSALADDPAKLAAACSFIDFATSPVFQDSKALTGLEISANQAVADQAAEVSQWPEVQAVFVSEADDARPDPNTRFSFFAIVEPRLDLMMENILAGADVTEEVNLAVEEINRELSRQ
ncbi:MAG: extracellular solute-binding protein [Anaerolineae bacterium]|nr:extracellular solute-binding protein [Anaerolineae bacterium]